MFTCLSQCHQKGMHLNVLAHTKCDEEQLAMQFILSEARMKS